MFRQSHILITHMKRKNRVILCIIIFALNIFCYGQGDSVFLPVMNVEDYSFMREISALIKGTDLNSTYPKEIKDRSNVLYRFDVADINYEQLRLHGFVCDGSYKITVNMEPMMCNGMHYNVFEIDGVVYASEDDLYLYPFYDSCKVEKKEFSGNLFRPLMNGGGCFWQFIVRKGVVVVAVYFCIDDCVCREDVRMYDLLNKCTITADEYENLYPGFYYD